MMAYIIMQKGMYDNINIPGAIYVYQNPVSPRTKDGVGKID